MTPQTTNQNPEQKARDRIDRLLELAGWVVQDMSGDQFHCRPIPRNAAPSALQTTRKPGC